MKGPDGGCGVMAVGGGAAAPGGRALDDAVAWFRRLSGGYWAPRPHILPPVRLPDGLGRYAALGGMAPAGPNSRDLAADALALACSAARAQLAAAGGRLVLVVPDVFRAHVWYLPRGGVALGGGAWCRQFALLPDSAPLGTVAHEFGHLLLGWPDGDPSAGRRCLMALGGHCGGGSVPAPPAAPLLLSLGWRRPLALTPLVTVSALAPGRVGLFGWRGREIVAEIRDGRLLAWTGPRDRPRLLAELRVEGAGALPVLGLLAPRLRRLRPEMSH